MGGILLVDQDGRPLSNYLSWRDQRTLKPHPGGGTYLDAIRRRWRQNELQELGNELQPGSATSLLFWLAENGQAPRRSRVLTLGDYVLMQVCTSDPCTEPTQAIGALNLLTGDWHNAAFDALGLQNVEWPRLARWNEAARQWRTHGRSIPCYPVVGDQQCALRGAMLKEGELSLNISTGSQLSLLTHELQLGPYQTRPYFDGAYLNTITHLPAGRALNVLVDLLSELGRAQGAAPVDPWPYIAEAAAAAPDSDLDVNLTFFAGPLGDQGRIDNINLDNLSVGSLFRAAFRDMAENYWTCADRLCPSHSWTRVVLSGGLAQRVPPLKQAILEKFGCAHRECPEGEDVLLGLMALWSNGHH
jgi:sugar (pentulose or hexulose) kinase